MEPFSRRVFVARFVLVALGVAAALVVVALVSSQMARPVRGQSPPFAQRAIIAARRLLFHRKKLTAQELANANADRRARGGQQGT